MRGSGTYRSGQPKIVYPTGGSHVKDYKKKVDG